MCKSLALAISDKLCDAAQFMVRLTGRVLPAKFLAPLLFLMVVNTIVFASITAKADTTTTSTTITTAELKDVLNTFDNTTSGVEGSINDGLTGALCNFLELISGKLAFVAAMIGVIFIGFMLYFGKFDLFRGLILALGIGVVFGYPTIVRLFNNDFSAGDIANCRNTKLENVSGGTEEKLIADSASDGQVTEGEEVSILDAAAKASNCEPGFYPKEKTPATTPATYECTECPTGYMCAGGGKDRVLCVNAGYAASSANTSCDICPKDWKITTSPNAVIGGTPATYNTGCVKCAVGKVCPGDGKEYSALPTCSTSGTICDSTMQSVISKCGDTDPKEYMDGSSCLKCPVNKAISKSSAGVKTCIACPAGYSCNGTETKVKCVKSQYAAEGAGKCQTCTGEIKIDATTKVNIGCDVCKAGYFCTGGKSYACGDGKFSKAGDGVCQTCPISGASGNIEGNASIILTSKDGTDNVNTDCTICPAGFICPTLAAKPADCPAGFMCPQGSKAGQACPADTIPSPDKISCVKCPTGYHGDKGSCVPNGTASLNSIYCPRGQIYNNTTSTCVDDTKNCSNVAVIYEKASTYNIATNTIPKNFTLPIGQVNQDIECALGYFGNFAIRCSDPSDKTFSQYLVTENKCVACRPGSSASLEAFKVGHASLNSPDACAPCAPGTYSDKTGQAQCTFCGAGTYNDASGMLSCKACPVNTYSSTIGNKSASYCLPCPEGTYNNQEGQTFCKVCPRDKYCDKGIAYDCPPGTYSVEGTGKCYPCTVGEKCRCSGNSVASGGFYSYIDFLKKSIAERSTATACTDATPCTLPTTSDPLIQYGGYLQGFDLSHLSDDDKTDLNPVSRLSKQVSCLTGWDNNPASPPPYIACNLQNNVRALTKTSAGGCVLKCPGNVDKYVAKRFAVENIIYAFKVTWSRDAIAPTTTPATGALAPTVILKADGIETPPVSNENPSDKLSCNLSSDKLSASWSTTPVNYKNTPDEACKVFSNDLGLLDNKCLCGGSEFNKYYLNGSSCAICPAGYQCDGSQKFPCTTTQFNPAGSGENCKTCPDGTKPDATKGACVPCDIGTVGTGGGCTGVTSPQMAPFKGMTASILCPANNNTCTNTSLVCKAGYKTNISPALGTVLPLPNASQFTCDICAAGEGGSGSAACGCSAGTIPNGQGACVSATCSADLSIGYPNSSLTFIGSGTAAFNANKTLICPQGYYGVGLTITCTQPWMTTSPNNKPTDQYAVGSPPQACAVCTSTNTPRNYVKNNQCLTAQAGYQPNSTKTDQEICLVSSSDPLCGCAAGQIANGGGACINSCTGRDYLKITSGVGVCTTPPLGQYVPAGSSTPQNCPAGDTSAPCGCAAGQIANGGGTCIASCTGSTYLSIISGIGSCVSIPNGQYIPAGSSTPQNCVKGQDGVGGCGCSTSPAQIADGNGGCISATCNYDLATLGYTSNTSGMAFKKTPSTTTNYNSTATLPCPTGTTGTGLTMKCVAPWASDYTQYIQSADDSCEVRITSCAHYLAKYPTPTPASGFYMIDPDGPSAGAAPFRVYCDMDPTHGGGGWTLVAAQFESDPAAWTGASNGPLPTEAQLDGTAAGGKSFTLTSAQLSSVGTIFGLGKPNLTAFGKGKDATFIGYSNFKYDTGDIPLQTLLNLKDNENYKIHRNKDNSFYTNNDPDQAIKTNTNEPWWLDTLTYDKSPGTYSWSFSPNSGTATDKSPKGFGMNANLMNSSDAYAWTVWTKCDRCFYGYGELFIEAGPGYKIVNNALTLCARGEGGSGGCGCSANEIATGISGAACAPIDKRSCDHIKAADSAAVSGNYHIDPDGSGPNAPFQTYCDMETAHGGGGWTLVAAHFWKRSPTGPGWNAGISPQTFTPPTKTQLDNCSSSTASANQCNLSNATSFTLSQSQLPIDATQTGFGRGSDATFAAYINLPYTTGNLMYSTPSIKNVKDDALYCLYRHPTNCTDYNNPCVVRGSCDHGGSDTLAYGGVAGGKSSWFFANSSSSAQSYDGTMMSNGTGYSASTRPEAWTVWTRCDRCYINGALTGNVDGWVKASSGKKPNSTKTAVENCTLGEGGMGGCGCPSNQIATGNGTCGSVDKQSCDHIQAAIGSTAASGNYHIDPDGSGPNAPFQTYCDMETAHGGGGWTLVAAKFYPSAMTSWNQGITSSAFVAPTTSQLNSSTSGYNSFSLNASQMPLRTQTAFGKGAEATYAGYTNLEYDPSKDYSLPPLSSTNNNTNPTVLFDLKFNVVSYLYRDNDSTGNYGRCEYATASPGGCGTNSQATPSLAYGHNTASSPYSCSGWATPAGSGEVNMCLGYGDTGSGTGAGVWTVWTKCDRCYIDGATSNNIDGWKKAPAGQKSNSAKNGVVNCTLGEGGLGGCGCPSNASPKGDGTCVGVRASCDQILSENSSATSGSYLIDPDGSGPSPVFQAYCNMTTSGGGWTLVRAQYTQMGVTWQNLSDLTKIQYKGAVGTANAVGPSDESTDISSFAAPLADQLDNGTSPRFTFALSDGQLPPRTQFAIGKGSDATAVGYATYQYTNLTNPTSQTTITLYDIKNNAPYSFRRRSNGAGTRDPECGVAGYLDSYNIHMTYTKNNGVCDSDTTPGTGAIAWADNMGGNYPTMHFLINGVSNFNTAITHNTALTLWTRCNNCYKDSSGNWVKAAVGKKNATENCAFGEGGLGGCGCGGNQIAQGNGTCGLYNKSCKTLLAAGYTTSGQYMIQGNILFPVYCDMDTTHGGGGWTLAAAQYENSIVSWSDGNTITPPTKSQLDNGGGPAIAYDGSQLPSDRTQVAFGKGSDATYVGYSNFVYTSSEIPVTDLINLKDNSTYQIFRSSVNMCTNHDPENGIRSTAATGEQIWNNTLTYDKKGQTNAYSWSFAPGASGSSRGFAMLGDRGGISDSYAWTVWVR